MNILNITNLTSDPVQFIREKYEAAYQDTGSFAREEINRIINLININL